MTRQSTKSRSWGLPSRVSSTELAPVESCLSAFSSEIREDLALDGVGVLEVEAETRQLQGPFRDSSRGVTVLKWSFQVVLGDHRDGMSLEVVPELAGGDEDG